MGTASRFRPIVLGVLIAAALCAVNIASACDCGRRLGMSEASLVFVGTPIGRTEWLKKGTGSDYIVVRYSFKVENVKKGVHLPAVVIDTDMSDCGIPFELGRRYEVYASSAPELGVQWHTSQCTATTEFPKGRP
jgi:hypothetical protein